jgi:hypothetical protein
MAGCHSLSIVLRGHGVLHAEGRHCAHVSEGGRNDGSLRSAVCLIGVSTEENIITSANLKFTKK